MKKIRNPFVLLLAAFLLMVTGAVGPKAAAQPSISNAKDGGKITTGAVAEGPMQVGCWHPVWHKEVPEWVFPMIYLRWQTPAESKKSGVSFTPEHMGFLIAEEAKKKPKTQPVWVMLHAWLGNRRPGWDKSNLIVHGDDATPAGTPGIWPKQGIKTWREYTTRMIKVMRKRGVRLDFWVDDHEMPYNMWKVPFAKEDAFKNIVLDPRWKTEKLLGFGFTGADLLDPARLATSTERVSREMSDRDLGNNVTITDCALSYKYVETVGQTITRLAMRKALTEPILAEYPKALVSSWKRGKQPLALGKGLNHLVIGDYDVWKEIQKLDPSVKGIPEMGNMDSNSLYHTLPYWERWAEARGITRTEAMLEYADIMIKYYGGPQYLAPWITSPVYGRANEKGERKRNATPEEYRQLILGLAKRGVGKYILWNPVQAGCNDPAGNEEMLSVFKEAYEILKKQQR